jgi:hypothetical protein
VNEGDLTLDGQRRLEIAVQVIGSHGTQITAAPQGSGWIPYPSDIFLDAGRPTSHTIVLHLDIEREVRA